MEVVRIFDPRLRRHLNIGKLDESGEFFKVVRKNHFCWKHHAFGIQEDGWEFLVSKDAKKLTFHYDTKNYSISMKKANRIKISDNLGSGPQFFIKKEECTCS